MSNVSWTSLGITKLLKQAQLPTLCGNSELLSDYQLKLPTLCGNSELLSDYQLKLLILNTPILIIVNDWDLTRALDRLKLQKALFSSCPSDVQLTLDTV